MKKHPDYKILLAGTTASAGTQKELVKLSEARCNTIKEILINAGIGKNQIETIGLGYKNHPYYIDDKNDDGSLNEKNAQKNRSVIIMGYESESAKKTKVIFKIIYAVKNRKRITLFRFFCVNSNKFRTNILKFYFFFNDTMS